MQNFLWPSEDLTSARYVKQAGTVITPDAALAPDGVSMTADLVDMSAAGAGTGWYQISAIVGNLGTTITRQVWLKGLVGGEVLTLQDAAYSLGTKTVTLTNEFLPYTFTSTTGATLASGLWVVKVSGNGYYAWGMSMANANWVGDYAKTTTSIINTGRPRDIVLKQNLLPYSNAFVTNWTNTAGSTVANSALTTAPDGTSTAVEFKEDAGLSIHRVTTTVALAVIGKQYTFSIFIKKGTRNFAALQFDSGSRFGNVNLTTGEVMAGQAQSTMTAKVLADGWVRVDITSVLTTGQNVYVYPATGLAFADTTYQGVLGDIAMYIWQAQYVQANHAGDLQPTVGVAINNPIRNAVLKQNLLVDSSNFSSANWTKRGTCTVTPNQAISPLTGLMTASLIAGMSGVGHDMYNTNYTTTVVLPANSTVTPSLYIRRVSTVGSLQIQNPTSSNLGWWRIDFAALQDNVWYRIGKDTPGFTEVYPFVSAPAVGVLLNATAADFSFYLDGAQLVKANWAGDFQPTVGVAITNPIRNVVLNTDLLAAKTDLEGADWERTQVTVTPDTDPNGGSRAFKVLALAAGDASAILTTVNTVAPASIYTYIASFKKGVGTRVKLRASDVTVGQIVAIFDTTSGALVSTTASSGTIISASTVSDGDGWFTATIVFRTGTLTTLKVGCYVSNINDYIYLFNPRLMVGAVRRNIGKQNLLRTSDFTSVLVTKVGTPTVTGGQLAPDGTLTAYNVTSANTTTYLQSQIGRALSIGKNYVTSVWLKADANCNVGMEFIDIGDGNPAYSVTQAVTTQWQQFSISAILGATAGTSAMGLIIGSRFAAWNTARTVTMWHPQIVEANWVGDDCPTSGVIIDNPIRNIVL